MQPGLPGTRVVGDLGGDIWADFHREPGLGLESEKWMTSGCTLGAGWFGIEFLGFLMQFFGHTWGKKGRA